MRLLFFQTCIFVAQLANATNEDDLREYCLRGKQYATELLLKAHGSSEFYYYMGKQCAYEEIVDYIDED